MRENIKSGVTFGIIGGLVTFIFGGWSVAVLGSAMGIGLGLSVGGHSQRKDFKTNAMEALPSLSVAAAILLVLSLLQNFIVASAGGLLQAEGGIVIFANLAGVLSSIILGAITAGLHGLPEKQERLGKMFLLGAVVAIFPFIDNLTSLRWTSVVIFALMYVILGMGLNIVVGYAGLLDLGYAAFFAIGAYTAGILSSTGSVLYLNNHILINFWVVIWIAAAVAAVFGIILGAPTLRLRGDYLAIVTLGFGEIIPIVFRNLIDITLQEPLTCWILPLFGIRTSCITFVSHLDLTAGEKGINPISRPSLPFIGEFQSGNTIPWYFLIIVIILFSIFIINRLRESRLGRAWMAIREDELAAAQMGINPVATKLSAFAMGATFSGFAGAFYGSYIAGIFPGAFEFSTSIIILCIVILGGLGNINGVIVGGLVIELADRLFLPALKDFFKGLLDNTVLPMLANHPVAQAAVAQNANPILYRSLLFGLTLVIMMAVRPEGLLPSAQRRMELHEADEAPNVVASSSLKS